MIKRPKSIAVGGYRYRVKLVPGLKVLEGVSARVAPTLHLIEIDKDANDKTELLLHEMLHTVNHVFLDALLEEKHIDPLSEGLFQALSSAGVSFDWKG